MLLSKKSFRTVLVILFLAILFSSRFSVGKKTRTLLMQCFRPVLKISESTVSFSRNIGLNFRTNRQLQNDNSALKNEIKLLSRRLIQLKEYDSENKRFRALLDLKEQVKEDALVARVIGRDLSGWSQIIIIDKGSKHGIKENLPVVASGGVVGKTMEVGLFSTKVLLLIDRKSRIGGIMQKSRVVGIVEGTGENDLIINYLPKDEGIYVNDLVLSSGLGLVYEKGLVIGTIKTIHEAKQGLYKYAKITPIVPFYKLEEVLVILEPKGNI